MTMLLSPRGRMTDRLGFRITSLIALALLPLAVLSGGADYLAFARGTVAFGSCLDGRYGAGGSARAAPYPDRAGQRAGLADAVAATNATTRRPA